MKPQREQAIRDAGIPPGSTLMSAVICVAIAGFLMFVAIGLPREPLGLTVEVLDRLGESGVEHPVTAVLLNFRAYDTWLELAVLLLGLLGILAVRGNANLRQTSQRTPADPVLRALVRVLVPLMIVVAGYLLWLGKYDAGGAFQAGVMLGVALLLLWFAGSPSVAAANDHLLRAGMAAGFGAFLLVAVATLFSAGVMLELPRGIAGDVILFIETFAAISIGITVAAMFIGLQPRSNTELPA